MGPDPIFRLILASSSPQRRDLLREAGHAFEVVPPGEAESAARANPRELAERLAYFKAREVADRVKSGLVLGADTLVVLGEQVIGKPTGPADARRILRTLAGTRHVVITGVCLLDAATGLRLVGSESTRIRMRPMSDHEIDEYVSSGAAAGKAGAYAVRAEGDPYVESMEGSFTNVVGLPMELVARMMRLAEHL